MSDFILIQVALKEQCTGKYIRASEKNYFSKEALWEELFTPIKDENGLWSFQSYYGPYLIVGDQGLVMDETDNMTKGTFSLEPWKGDYFNDNNSFSRI